MSESSDRSNDSGVDDLLDAIRRVVFPEGALCTGWVLVTEWVDLDGQHWTYTAKDSNNPIWRHEGLLQHVLNNGLDVTDDDEDEGY
jgi:hypothetical protein